MYIKKIVLPSITNLYNRSFLLRRGIVGSSTNSISAYDSSNVEKNESDLIFAILQEKRKSIVHSPINDSSDNSLQEYHDYSGFSVYDQGILMTDEGHKAK